MRNKPQRTTRIRRGGCNRRCSRTCGQRISAPLQRTFSSWRVMLCREGALLLLCAISDVLPKLLDSYSESVGLSLRRGGTAILRAAVDNGFHAAIAAASWTVVVALSPPSPGTCLCAALRGSPAHRCISLLVRRRQPRRSPPDSNQMQTAPVPTMEGRIREVEEISMAGCSKRRGAEVREIFVAACLGSALDLDHFMAAGSMRLSKATGLAERPWGHSVAAFTLAATAAWMITFNKRAAGAVFSAGASHQLRDSIRRGLWLYPPHGPKTPPLPYPGYLIAEAVLPLGISLFLRWRFHGFRRTETSECRRSRKLSFTMVESNQDRDITDGPLRV